MAWRPGGNKCGEEIAQPRKCQSAIENVNGSMIIGAQSIELTINIEAKIESW
jgi:hypothetical protein